MSANGTGADAWKEKLMRVWHWCWYNLFEKNEIEFCNDRKAGNKTPGSVLVTYWAVAMCRSCS